MRWVHLSLRHYGDRVLETLLRLFNGLWTHGLEQLFQRYMTPERELSVVLTQ